MYRGGDKGQEKVEVLWKKKYRVALLPIIIMRLLRCCYVYEEDEQAKRRDVGGVVTRLVPAW